MLAAEDLADAEAAPDPDVGERLRRLDSLADAGLEIALDAAAESRAARGTEGAAQAIAQLALAYERAARAVRLTVVLQSALINNPASVGLSAAALSARARAQDEDDEPGVLEVRWVDPDEPYRDRAPAPPRVERPETLDITDADLARPWGESVAAIQGDLARAEDALGAARASGAGLPPDGDGGPGPDRRPGGWDPFAPSPAAHPPPAPTVEPQPPPRRDFIDMLCNGR